MKKLHALVGASSLLALLVGCQSSSTTASRIQEKSTVFAGLAPAQQKSVQGGVVEVGYTGDMVYMALGRPTKVSVTADGKVGIWTYENYFPTDAVSSRPLYAIRPGPRGRVPAVLASGPSAAGAHDNAAQPVGNTPREAYSNRSFTNWSAPEYGPVTLHVMFTAGHVSSVALGGENS